jgi:hypothetical protein
MRIETRSEEWKKTKSFVLIDSTVKQDSVFNAALAKYIHPTNPLPCPMLARNNKPVLLSKKQKRLCDAQSELQ